MSMTAPAVAIKPATGGRRLRDAAAGSAGTSPKPTLLKWIDLFETGNVELDPLHRKLVEDCNDLLTLLADDGAWPLIVTQAKKVVVDCIEHFRIEDLMLERIKFPRREAHAAEHRKMEQEMRSLVARMEQVEGSLRAHRDLPASLGPAIIDLMIRHDLDYRSHVLYRQGR